MAFSLTFQSILDSNIKHIYSGNPSHVVYRHSKEYPNMDQLRQMKEDQHLKDFVLRTSEYREDYKCLIPRAPAFRQLSPEEVDDIVARLHEPKPDHDALDGEKKEEGQGRKTRRVTKEEMDEITERLHNTVTMATTIRVNQTREAGHPPVHKVET